MRTGDAVDDDFAALASPGKGPQRRAAERLAALVPRRPDVRARLVGLLADSDPQRRWGAAYALGVSAQAGVECVEVLIDVLGDRDGDLRWAATRLLTAMAPRTPAVGTAVTAALDSSSPLRRKMALYALRDLGLADLGVLARHLGDADPAVRMAALSAVASCGAKAEVAHLVGSLLGDPDPGVRRAAAATAGRIGALPPEIVTVLERLAEQTGDASLARAARAALKRRGGHVPPRR